MSHQHYQDLITAQSLDKEIKGHLDVIASHNQRIEVLENQRKAKNDFLQEKEELLKNSTKESSELEKTLSSLESKIEKSNEHLSVASTQQQMDAINKELETLKPQTEEIEEKILELLELIDITKSEIEDAKTFLAGSLETLEEMKIEVTKETNIEDGKIKILEDRIENILSLVPDTYKKLFISVREKYRFKNPISFLIERKCNQCKFAIDITIQENLNNGVIPEQCPSCARLILPPS